jgi:hypothetical protein
MTHMEIIIDFTNRSLFQFFLSLLLERVGVRLGFVG